MPRRKKVDHRKSGIETVDPDVAELLQGIATGKMALKAAKGTRFFSQGEGADTIYFIEKGRVKISVVSTRGREAVLVILGPRDFFGEGCLVGQPFRISTATALESCALVRVDKRAMLQALSSQAGLSERFIAALLVRNIKLEEDLCDQLFNHSERRLARVLLKLARLGHPNELPDARFPRLSHETLAEMVGTTRSRITHFMNKFRRLGLIDYNGEFLVRTELLTDIVLHD